MSYVVKSYIDCRRCDLYQFRKKIVFGRGDVPAKILFIGEGPGRSENAIGEAFVGRSGRLLRKSLKSACSLLQCEMPSAYYTNLVACRPCDSKAGQNRPPKPEEIWACWERLRQTYYDVRPYLVVYLGDVAARSCGSSFFPRTMKLRHPAYVLRQGGFGSAEYRSFVRSLMEAISHVLQS